MQIEFVFRIKEIGVRKWHAWAASRFENICQQHNIFGMVADFKYTPSNKARTRLFEGGGFEPA